MAKGLYILVGVLPSRHLDLVLGVFGVNGDSFNLKRRLVNGRNFCVAALNPVLRWFIELKTERTLRLSVSRFLATVLAAACHTCELQFRAAFGLLADRRVNEYGHSSSNRSMYWRCTSDSTKHSVNGLGLHRLTSPMKLNLRRIMTASERREPDDECDTITGEPHVFGDAESQSSARARAGTIISLYRKYRYKCNWSSAPAV